MLKISDLLNHDINPFLMGIFFSRRVFTQDDRYIFVYSYFRESKVIETEKINYNSYLIEYMNKLNQLSGDYPFWNTKEYYEKLGVNFGKTPIQAAFVVENDINIDRESLYNKLYRKLVSSCDWLYELGMTEKKKEFIRGYMELRGSIDTTAPYIAQDSFADSNLEIRKPRILVDYFDIPHYITNINFRELQKDFVTGRRKRNTQFRLNIFWYLENIGIYNAYKAEIFSKSRNVNFNVGDDVYYFNFDAERYRHTGNILDERLNFYFTFLKDKEPTADEIEIMRHQLGFESGTISVRSRALSETVLYTQPDECVCCKNRYRIEERSHINPRTGRYYFEIHHVISIGHNRELDDENNMVKLCSECHTMLKKGYTDKETQKSLIRDIFNNAPHTYEFAKEFFNTIDFEEIVENVYLSLK